MNIPEKLKTLIKKVDLSFLSKVKSYFTDVILLKCRSFLTKVKSAFYKKSNNGETSVDKKKLSSLIYSCVALSLIIVMLVAMTSTWLMSNFTTDITSNDFIKIDADAGLNMNYGDHDNNQGTIDITQALTSDFELVECSSPDGRNFFFPLSEFSDSNDVLGADGEHSNNANTQDMRYREGTSNDRNTKYISVDFSLSAQGETDVWISQDSEITVKNIEHLAAAKSLRFAFIENKIDGKSVVFDNSTDTGYAETTNAVSKIDNNGVLTETTTYKAHSITEYQFGNSFDNKLFHIEKGEELFVTMNIWLEGTDENTVTNAANNPILNVSDLDIKIKFTTSYEDERTIYFVDKTLESWVDDDDCFVFAIVDGNMSSPKRMRQSQNYENDRTWSVDIPASAETVQFARYNPDIHQDIPEKWNIWPVETLGITATYTAFGHNTGIWANNFNDITITLFDGTAKGYLTDNSAPIHVVFTETDGNGVVKEFNYKMSYQDSHHRWQIVIPGGVDELEFHRLNPANNSIWDKWECKDTLGNADTSRNECLYYTATDKGGKGYWSNKLIYLDAYDEVNKYDYKNNAGLAAYFYSKTTGGYQWVGMRAKTDIKEGYVEPRYIAAEPPSLNSGVVLVRYNQNAEAFSFDESVVYNKIPESLENYGTNNLFKITGWTGENNKLMNGAWYTTDEHTKGN